MNPKKLRPRRVSGWAWSLLPLIVLPLVIGVQCKAPTPLLPATYPAHQAIRVAVLTPMTGELATFGETVRNGITLAFDEWNEKGLKNGQYIEWVLEDTRCDPSEGRQAAERAINEQGARFIVGGVCSEAAIPIARIANEQGALFVATTATHPLVTVDGDGVTRAMAFRAGYAYPYQGKAAARFALDGLGARRAAVLIDPSNDYVKSLATEFTTAFIAGGGQVVAAPTYPQGAAQGRAGGSPRDADFGAIIAEVAKSAPEVLYVPDAYPVANRVASHVRQQKLAATLIGSDVWDNGALDLERLEGAFFTVHYSRQTPGSMAQDWEERYLSAFAIEPDTLAALGYDAARLLVSAMENAGTASPGAVAAELEDIEFKGVTGDWHFDAQHNPIKPVVVMQIKDSDVIFHSIVQP